MAISSLNDVPTVALAIQQAVAPVFLLTGIGSILAVLTNRLGRAIDRMRRLNEMDSGSLGETGKREVRNLSKRTLWIRRAITLCTLSALCVCLSIASLFIAVQLAVDLSDVVAMLFIAAMLSLICGLASFLREIALATQSVDSAK
ncbi:DUF2721 domain-containing protein [Methylomonas rapida]|uniref:DUF2721 domain-containing protein n=1 Tax=Methylomonas rapida TaxID=2963939 RepID=A0ABY7GGR1_9GAMM|nr:DUF2721 domain-containing protein [Methylomonas rapida]WAR43999.1 DUF2721 domain-containing protein [Methylomonas rapida]